ncbi:glycerol-3-phosphate dehydrogenase [Asanoa ferruginea]|uniref:Glycerol-3-phosphate dehydrogenase n=1 Tax=Asanoa ferruginea TaxID=53367 RepID=A0A3D9ZV41_9ACTN|nr:glycerol-3-phosphate dehydrogenase/oxidase [Asanoa ferruginea]REG00363.1 glycerol-3-phosphate dehydrogenase [Asanoa ferruginea]GIF53192.1 FAD-dependent oxidoreductase [Asanoa ferruginea]
MEAVALSAAQRNRALAGMAERELDILVVGGGVVGAGCALDAVTRGLSTGLVEARDWASGTSSRSSKLMHGGLRYLEQFEFGLVAESLRERGLLLQRIAPHLVHPVQFLYPLKHRFWERPYVGSGLILYDTMGLTSGTARGVPHHRHLTRRGALKVAPGLKKSALIGAVQYYDGQVDDARHTMTVVRTAASYGALVANRARVVDYLREGDQVVGALVEDLMTGNTREVHAKQVINSTGVWTDDTQQLADTRGEFHVRASKGVHFTVPRDRIQLDTGLILRTEKSVLFVIPWGRHWLIGTTDTDWDLDKARPAATSTDIEYLLDHVNRVLINPLTEADIEGVYVGLRPLVAGDAQSTSKLSRDHMVARPVPGMVVVAGGKYTTYRKMAEDTVDEAVRGLDQENVPESPTKDIPLVGADGYHALWNQRHELAEVWGLHVHRIEHLLNRYGSLIFEVLRLIAQDRSLADPLPGADDYLRAEAVYAASHEGALHLDDVLARRTRSYFETFSRGVQAAPDVARLMGAVLGWTDVDVDREVTAYEAAIEADRKAQEAPDDAAADAARLVAVDLG